jgi:hypothetical protein
MPLPSRIGEPLCLGNNAKFLCSDGLHPDEGESKTTTIGCLYQSPFFSGECGGSGLAMFLAMELATLSRNPRAIACAAGLPGVVNVALGGEKNGVCFIDGMDVEKTFHEFACDMELCSKNAFHGQPHLNSISCDPIWIRLGEIMDHPFQI